MSNKDNDTNKLDLTSEMTDDWDSELNEEELSNPDDLDVNHDEIDSNHSPSDEEELDEEELDKDEGSDEDEDSDEDSDETESVSLLSTNSGKILVGASVFGAGILGLAGFVLLGGGDNQEISQPEQQGARIKPVFEEIPSDNSSFEKVAQASSEVIVNEPVQTVTDNSQVVVNDNQEPVAIDSVIVNAEPEVLLAETKKDDALVINFDEVKKDTPASSDQGIQIDFGNTEMAKNQNEAIVPKEKVEEQRFNLDLLNKDLNSEEVVQKEPEKVETIQFEEVKSEEHAIDTVKADELNKRIDSLDETLKVAVMKEDVNSIVKDIFVKENKEDKTKIANLESQVKELTSKLDKKLSSLEVKSIKKETVAKVDPVSLKRERLKGFKIINTTMDGAMSVVKAPSGRTVILYKGEKFYVQGKGSFTVNEVLNGGELLLANKHYYIDTVYEKPDIEYKKQVQKPVEKSVQKPEVQKEVIVEMVEENNPNVIVNKLSENKAVNVARLADNININSSKKVAQGFTWNGQMGNEYIIQMPNGEWEMVKAGDKIEGLGMVNGLSDNNNLIVGEFVIEKAKD